MATRHRALLSAHRCGRAGLRALDNTVAGVHASAACGADYLEIDIHVTVDGHLVCTHDDTLRHHGRRHRIAYLTRAQVRAADPRIEDLDQLLAAIAGTGRAAHLDLKAHSPAGTRWQDSIEVAIAERAAGIVGPERMIVTTVHDQSVTAVRAWARAHGHDVLVGLSLGRDTRGLPHLVKARVLLSELFPGTRVAACDPNLLVVHHLLGRLRLLRWAHRRRLPVLVWTVDRPRLARKLMSDRRVWLLTTNWPARLTPDPTHTVR